MLLEDMKLNMRTARSNRAAGRVAAESKETPTTTVAKSTVAKATVSKDAVSKTTVSKATVSKATVSKPTMAKATSSKAVPNKSVIGNTATEQSPSEKPAPRGVSAVRASAPWLEFRAWRAGRPFAGAILTIIAGIEMFFSSQLDLGNIHVQVGIEGFQSTIIPAVMVTVGLLTLFNPTHRIFYGVISLVVAVYSLVGLNLGGFFIGMLLGAIGGILVVSWIAKPVKGIDETETEAHESPVATGRKLAAEPRPLAHSRS